MHTIRYEENPRRWSRKLAGSHMASCDVNYGTCITFPSPAVHKKDQLQVRIESQCPRKKKVFLKQKNLPELLVFSC